MFVEALNATALLPIFLYLAPGIREHGAEMRLDDNFIAEFL
jgi:hypothetical protein